MAASNAYATPRRAAAPLGKKMEEREICVKNMTGAASAAKCSKSTIIFGFKNQGHGMILNKSGTWKAESAPIVRGSSRCVKPFLDVNRTVTMWISWENKCEKLTQAHINRTAYQNCTSGMEYFNIGHPSAPTMNFSFYADCSLR